jgi:hypothetical protein
VIATALAFLTGNWIRLALYGVVILGALGTAAGVGYHKGVQRLWDYQVEQARQAVKIVLKQGEVTERVIIEYIEREAKIRTVTQTIEKEVVRYVDSGLDRCPLSVAAVSLHDAAVANTVPDAARSTDGTASGLETAALTQTCTENYAEYHRTASRLTGLQKWVTEQGRVKP